MVNEGLSTAIITLHGPARFGGVHTMGGDRFALLPGDSADFSFEDGRTVAEWAEGWKRRQEAPNEPRLFLEVIVMDQFDDGIVDKTEVLMGGYPIVPIEGNDAGWIVRGLPHVALDQVAAKVWSAVMPTRRRYFRSRADNREVGTDE